MLNRISGTDSGAEPDASTRAQQGGVFRWGRYRIEVRNKGLGFIRDCSDVTGLFYKCKLYKCIEQKSCKHDRCKPSCSSQFDKRNSVSVVFIELKRSRCGG